MPSTQIEHGVRRQAVIFQPALKTTSSRISPSCALSFSLDPATSHARKNTMPSFAQCTEVTPSCPVEATTYGYYPNLGGNVFYAAFFGLLAVLQLGLGLWFRTWTFLVAVAVGAILELVGYIGRIQMHSNPWLSSAFKTQIVCLVRSHLRRCRRLPHPQTHHIGLGRGALAPETEAVHLDFHLVRYRLPLVAGSRGWHCGGRGQFGYSSPGYRRQCDDCRYCVPGCYYVCLRVVGIGVLRAVLDTRVWLEWVGKEVEFRFESS